MKIDPAEGAPMTDIQYEYKSALHRAHARDAVEREEAARIRRGLPAFTEEEYRERLAFYLERIPYKELKMRYANFTRYFGHLKRLGWVEESGKTEPSAVQEPAPVLLILKEDPESITVLPTLAGKQPWRRYPIRSAPFTPILTPPTLKEKENSTSTPDTSPQLTKQDSCPGFHREEFSGRKLRNIPFINICEALQHY